MKIRIAIIALVALAAFLLAGINPLLSFQKKSSPAAPLFRDGDIIFQVTESETANAIALATHSRYTHCGLIYSKANKMYVMEAIQPVSSTALDEFIARGKNGHYVVKRLKGVDTILTTERIIRLKAEAENLKGKNYDIYFGWDDDLIYCSELVWKVYARTTGIHLGDPEKLKNFDLTHPLVKKQLEQRYGKYIPLNEPVISPARIFGAPALETVYEGN